MARQRLGIIMNGVTGRMGTHQHLARSIIAIRDQGGVALKNGDRVVPDLDWDKTLAVREHLWALGLGVAEAMDTAQRGMGLDWPRSRELIERSIAAGKSWSAREGRPALIASGCGTDHLDPALVRSIDEVIRAYEDQMHAVEAAGGRLILMTSRALARGAIAIRLRAHL